MSCELKIDGDPPRCSLAEKWSGFPVVPVTDDACRVCLSLNNPKGINRVTVSLAIAQARKEQSSDEFKSLLQRGRPYLSEPGLVEKIGRYASSTQNWIAAGSPIRNDEEVDAVLKICQGCEQFSVNKDGETGHCKVCGCEVNRMGGMVNKIRRATEHCPLGKW